MRKNFVVSTLLAVAFSISSAGAISKVTRANRYLYTDDGNRFYIKGIAYQGQGEVVASDDNAFGEPTSFTDPLADSAGCSRDVSHLTDLGVNTIRVYSVNSSLNHDECMSTFSNAGIYTIIDLALPLNGSIDRTSPSWSSNLMDQYLRTIDAFNKYDNVLAYNVGNEVIIEGGTGVSPFIKSAARDIKAYLKSISSSALVGYAAIDGSSSWRNALADYLSCDPSGQNSDSTAIDIYGLNNYEWCGDSSFQASYAGTSSTYQDYNVVAYFSEFGCITSPPRLWTEVAALLSANMSDIWSGGVAFSYFPATSVQGQFGMVNISSDGSTVTTGDDYNRLKEQYTAAQPPNTPSQSDAGSQSYPACPSTSADFVASTTLPPTPNEAACDCLENSLGCQFTPQTSNYSAIVGELIGTACGLLGQAGSNCDDIAANGTTGTYGRVSGCDPTIKLSFVMDKFYELNQRNSASCDFAGNASVNPLAPSASAANAAASSCLSNPSATFTPSSPPSAGGSGSTSGSGSGSGSSGGSSSSGNGAVPLFADQKALVGLMGMTVVGLVSAVATLL